MSTEIITGTAEQIKVALDAIIAAATTVNFIVKLEAGKVLVVYTP